MRLKHWFYTVPLRLRSLFRDPERLVRVEVNSGTNTGGAVEGGLFFDWQEQSRTLEGIAAINSGKPGIYKDWGRAHARRLIGGGEAEMVEVGQITASFFTVLGVKPLPPGRNFLAAEDRRGSDRVAILSYGLWQRRYNADPEIVGKTITIDAVFRFTLSRVIDRRPPAERNVGQFSCSLPYSAHKQRGRFKLRLKRPLC